MPTLDEIKAGIDRNLPAGWSYECWPLGPVDNPMDLSETRIYGLAYDSDGAAVGADDADWFLLRFWEDRAPSIGALIFFWATSVRSARSAFEVDAKIIDAVEAARRRLETLARA